MESGGEGEVAYWSGRGRKGARALCHSRQGRMEEGGQGWERLPPLVGWTLAHRVRVTTMGDGGGPQGGAGSEWRAAKLSLRLEKILGAVTTRSTFYVLRDKGMQSIARLPRCPALLLSWGQVTQPNPPRPPHPSRSLSRVESFPSLGTAPAPAPASKKKPQSCLPYPSSFPPAPTAASRVDPIQEVEL